MFRWEMEFNMSYRDGLKFQFTKMDALQALSQPISSLLGGLETYRLH